MSSTVYPRGCGLERDGSTCAVRAPVLFMHVPTYVGVCERDTNLERYSVWVLESFLGGSIKKFNICNVCEIESWI